MLRGVEFVVDFPLCAGADIVANPAPSHSDGRVLLEFCHSTVDHLFS